MPDIHGTRDEDKVIQYFKLQSAILDPSKKGAAYAYAQAQEVGNEEGEEREEGEEEVLGSEVEPKKWMIKKLLR